MSLERYKTNPFLTSVTVPMKNKKVQISVMGKDDNIQLMNHDTGEVSGTVISTFKRVDSEQFIKLFTSNIAMTFDLSAAGIKTLGVLIWAVQNHAIAKDEVTMDNLTREEFLSEHSDREPPLKLSYATMKRGINELERSKIIAKTMRAGRYFINPAFLFNGDRVAFMTVIERDTSLPLKS